MSDVAVDMQEVKRLTNRGLTLLTMNDNAAFLSAFILQRPPRFDERIGTAAVDAAANLLLAPKFVLEMFADAQHSVFVLAHEALHVLFDDVGECNGRDPRMWNLACDAWNNAQLVEANIGTPPPGAFFLRDVPVLSMTKPEIYSYMVKQGGAELQGDGLAGDIVEAIAQATPSSKAATRAELQARITGAVMAATVAGDKPGVFAVAAQELLQTKTPWQRIMSDFFQAVSMRERSWNKPDRRHLGRKLYLPGQARSPSMGDLGVVIDVSGSIDQRMLDYFGANLNALMEQTLPDSVVVAYCDTEVRHSVTYTTDDVPIMLSCPAGGGGTNMPAALHWMGKEHPVDACVVLTDGYTPWPSQAPPFPVMWGITTSVVPPAGRWVHIEYEEN